MIDPHVAFDVVDLTGVLANGILGGVVARSLKLDAVGFLFLAIITALGGGLLRDTLLNLSQPVAITNPLYLVMALVGAAIAYFVPMRGRWTRRVLTVADALSLGCWAATGTAKALNAGVSWLPAVFLGLVTAVGGGMIRDLLVGRIPAVFGGNTLYATGALIASVEMVVFWELRLESLGMAASIVSAAALTVLARRFGWRLPGPAQWLEEWRPPRLPALLRRRLREQPAPPGVPTASLPVVPGSGPDAAPDGRDDDAAGRSARRLTPSRLLRARGSGRTRR